MVINNQNSEVLSEFYIIIFLNKLKIVENTPPNERRRRKLTKAMGTFRDSQAPSWLSGSRSDVPTEPPLIRPYLNILQLFKTSRLKILVRSNFCVFQFFLGHIVKGTRWSFLGVYLNKLH